MRRAEAQRQEGGPSAAEEGPLYATRLERAVLGAVLANPEAARELVESLRSHATPDDFGTPAHGLIFQAMARVASQGQLVDHVTLSEELERMGKLAEAGGAGYLVKLDQALGEYQQRVGAISPERVGAWCGVLRDRAIRRRMVVLAKAMMEEAQRVEKPVSQTLGEGIAKLARVSVQGNRLRTLRSVKEQVKQEITDRDEGKYEPAVFTGLQKLDELTGGLPMNLTILAAMGGVGKSGLAYSIALRVAAGVRRPDGTPVVGRAVGICSCEDPARSSGYRFLAAESGIRSFRLRHAKFVAHEWEEFGRAWAAMEEYDHRIIFDDRQRPAAADVVQVVREMAVVHGCKLVFVDNVTAVRFPRVRDEKKTEAIEEWLGDLREIATSHGVAVVTIHHVKRREGLTPKNIPLLTDVKDSSGAENLARLMLLAARQEGSNLFRLALPKQTDGDAGDVIDLFFDEEAQMVRDRTAQDEAANTPDGFPIGSERAKANARRPRRKKEEGFTSEPEHEQRGESDG